VLSKKNSKDTVIATLSYCNLFKTLLKLQEDKKF